MWFWIKLNRYFNKRDKKIGTSKLHKSLVWFKADKSFGKMTKEEHLEFINRVANKLFDNPQKNNSN
jgi:hypothetical protein